MENQIIFAPDYRSPPSGLGTIDLNGDLILIQAAPSGNIHKGLLPYSHIYQLGTDNEDHDLETHEKLMTLLRNLRVTHVYDPELDMSDVTLKLELWDNVVRKQL